MKIVDWFRNIFAKKSGTIDLAGCYPDTETSIALEAFALITTVELIAGLLAKCEFKTYRNNQEFHGREWYSLNYCPNVNQNAVQFRQEIFCKLLYQKEVLIIPVNGQKIIADDFRKTEFAVSESRFSEISRGGYNFYGNFAVSDVYYLKYSNFESSLILDNIFRMYSSLIDSAGKKYDKSCGERGILKINAIAQGDKDFETKFRTLMNSYFKSYFDNSNAVLPLFDGYDYSAVQNGTKSGSSEISDIRSLFDDALARAAQAFKIPAVLLRGDVAGMKDAYDIMLTNCIDPLAELISVEFTGKQFTEKQICDGCRIVLDTSGIRHADIFDTAASIDKLISSGFASVDEVREKAGMSRLGTDWSERHYMTKNYERIGDDNIEK